MENILNKIEISKCTGCGLCEFVCPKHCISVKENEKGFFKAYINENECLKCGLCSKLCHTQTSIKNNDFELYGGRSNDDFVLKQSRSGGLFYVLAKKIIEMGGVVIGAAFDNNFEVKHIKIDKVEDLHKIQGSKYVQSDFRDVFRIVKECNEKKQTVIVGGTGCQIASLKNFVDFYKLDASKILLVDIVCHGTPSRSIFRRYLDQYKKYGIIGFEFRDKSFKWSSHIETCYTISKGRIESREYTDAFYSHLILSDNCFVCRYKSINRVGDISLADFWGLQQKNKNLFNELGNALFFINSKQGRYFFSLIKDDFCYFEVNQQENYWQQPPLKGNWEKPGNYDKFWNDFHRKKYSQLRKKYFVKKPLIIVRLYHFVKKILVKIKKKIF